MNIYLITNLISGKLYVGSTIMSIEKRFKCHCSCRTQPVGRDISALGRENFSIELLERIPGELYNRDREAYWIDKLCTYNPNGYNAARVYTQAHRQYKADKQQASHLEDKKRREEWTAANPGRKRQIGIQVKAEEKKLFEAVAEARGINLTSLVRRLMHDEARRLGIATPD